jgi:bifunctional DNA-binding transcriptional regulator/antitoxin component of YhaV-PrlF toxin-antitoxin module
MSEENYVVDITTVYANGKTQIPRFVRQMLNIKDGDKLIWVVIRRGEETEFYVTPMQSARKLLKKAEESSSA